MNVFFKPTFIKDFKKLPSDIQREVHSLCTEAFPKLRSIRDLKNYNLKPIKGFPGYYRIRLGDYRICFKLSGESKIECMRVKNRKDIYKHFP